MEVVFLLSDTKIRSLHKFCLYEPRNAGDDFGGANAASVSNSRNYI